MNYKKYNDYELIYNVRENDDSSYNYLFPSKSGTVALTNDLDSLKNEINNNHNEILSGITETIEDVKFTYYDSGRIYIYYNGLIYTLTEAYEDSVLTLEDLTNLLQFSK